MNLNSNQESLENKLPNHLSDTDQLDEYDKLSKEIEEILKRNEKMRKDLAKNGFIKKKTFDKRSELFYSKEKSLNSSEKIESQIIKNIECDKVCIPKEIISNLLKKYYSKSKKKIKIKKGTRESKKLKNNKKYKEFYFVSMNYEGGIIYFGKKHSEYIFAFDIDQIKIKNLSKQKNNANFLKKNNNSEIIKTYKAPLNIFKSIFVPSDMKCLFFLSFQQLLFEEVEKIETIKIKEYSHRNMVPFFEIDKLENTVTSISLMKCQTRLIFTISKPGKKSQKYFSKFMIVDLECKIKGNVKGKAYGCISDNNIDYDFDGNIIFSIVKKKKKYKLNFSKLSINKDKQTFDIKSRIFNFDDSVNFEKIPNSACFLESLNLILIGSKDGFLFAFDTFETKFKKIQEINLDLQFQYTILQDKKQKKQNNLEFVEKMIHNYNEKYVLAQTNNMKILVFRVKRLRISLATTIKFDTQIIEFCLSGNGRYLAISGMDFESIKRIDLSSICSNSFGDLCINYLTKLRDRSTEEGIKNADKEKTIKNKKICYKFGSINNYLEYLLEEEKIQIINEQKKMNEIYKLSFRNKFMLLMNI